MYQHPTFIIYSLYKLMQITCLIVVWAVLWSAATSGGALIITDQVLNMSIYNNLQTICRQAPLWNLNVCNRTCQECLPRDPYGCSSCRSQYILLDKYCHIDESIHNYTYLSLLDSLDYASVEKNILQFQYSTTGQPLNKSNIVAICQTNTYQFFMAGLFQPIDRVGLTLSFPQKVDQISIRFNLLSVIQEVTLYVQIGTATVYSETFLYFSDLQGTYSVSTTGPNLLIINALTEKNANSILVPMNTGILNIVENNFSISIYINTTETQQWAWGFNDFVVVTRSCQTCVSTQVQSLIDALSITTGITAAICIMLIILLFVSIKTQEFRRKKNLEAKLGTSSEHLPIKAIDRVLQTLAKFRQERIKDFDKQDHIFTKMTKRA